MKTVPFLALCAWDGHTEAPREHRHKNLHGQSMERDEYLGTLQEHLNSLIV